MRALTALLALCACTGTTANDDPPDVGDPELETIIVEVSYEPDAEPYTGPGPFGGNTWDLFDANAAALFQGTGVGVQTTSELAQMQALADQPGEDFDSAAILALDDAHRRNPNSAETLVFHAIWLDGYFADSGGRRDNVLGVSIGNTGVIAMFKPVIRRLGLTDVTRRPGEQAVLIHEFGHAVGLVDNGIAMQTPHKDAEHGDHCDNDNCVMYWANEGSSELAEFVATFVTDGETVLFDDDCLADVRAAATP